MPGKIHFMYRALYDVVIAHVEWDIDTEEDLSAWAREYDVYFKKRFTRKVDLVLELSKFHVNPRLAEPFGKLRMRILGDYAHRSYRVRQGPRERAMMNTSRAMHGAPANHFETIDDALKAMLEERAKDSRKKREEAAPFPSARHRVA
jgi:hypothetical protein